MKKAILIIILLTTAMGVFSLHRATSSARTARGEARMTLGGSRVSLKALGAQLSKDLGPVVLWGFGGIVATLIILPITIEILQKRKGSIVIVTERNHHRLGEPITGSLHVRTKQNLSCEQLTLTLRCLIDCYETNGSRSRRIVYEDTVVVAYHIDLHAGVSQRFPFSISTPAEVAHGHQIDLDSLSELGGAGRFARSALKTAFAVEGRGRRWELIAIAAVAGVDLTTTQSIVIAPSPQRQTA